MPVIYQDFVKLVALMRDAQKKYLEKRKENDLFAAKGYERLVDKQLVILADDAARSEQVNQ